MAIPHPINTGTATQLRGDHLGKPQTPCPEVHPLPNLVPNPTKKPAIPNPTKSKPNIVSSGFCKTTEFLPYIIGPYLYAA